MNRKPLVSLAMIVKNEEKWIHSSLSSAAPWVDEMILVDTGSTDRTMEIARDFGARVYEHPWRADFAIHRNQSLTHATGEWVLVLDADEQLDQKTASFLRQLDKRFDVDAFFVEILHLAKDGGHSQQATPRLLRRDSGVRFQGRIHENLVGGNRRSLRAPLRLIHHGFSQGQDIMREKAMRNLGLIRAWIDDEPENVSARTYLAQTLMAWPDTAPEALGAALEALEMAKQQKVPQQFLPRIYHPIWISLTQMNRPGEVILWANECEKLLPDYPDSLFSLTWAHLKLEHWELVCLVANRFMTLQDYWAAHPLEYPYTQNLSLNLRHLVLKRWILALARIPGGLPRMQVLFARLLKEAKGPETAHSLLMELRQAGFDELAVHLDGPTG